MSWRHLLSYLTGTSRRSLMTLPPELQSMILHCLPFKDLVTMATVCRHFRALALGERRLWKELPQASLDNVDKLLPFLDRAGKLGTALRIDGIQQDRIDYLVEILYFAVPALRSLRLHFQCEKDIDSGAMGRVMYAIAKSAPLLEHLELASSNYLDPLSVLPRLPTFYTPPPRLSSLKLTSYTLEGPPPAFCNVTDVVTTLAVLCPFPQAGLQAEPQWTNATLHEKFPEVRRLKLTGIDSGPWLAGDSEAYALRRLPYIDEPLSELELHFLRARERADIGDPEAVRWITEGTANVHRLVLQHLDCFAVRDAALMSLAGSSRLYLHIWSLGEGLFEICAVCQTTGQKRAVRLLKQDLNAHLARILASPLMRVTELVLHRGSWTPDLLHMFAGYRHLETLRFVRNAAGPLFPAVPNGMAALNSVKSFQYWSRTPVQIDASDLVAFVSSVVPRITSVVMSQSVSILDSHTLPPTICLGRM